MICLLCVEEKSNKFHLVDGNNSTVIRHSQRNHKIGNFDRNKHLRFKNHEDVRKIQHQIDEIVKIFSAKTSQNKKSKTVHLPLPEKHEKNVDNEAQKIHEFHESIDTSLSDLLSLKSNNEYEFSTTVAAELIEEESIDLALGEKFDEPPLNLDSPKKSGNKGQPSIDSFLSQQSIGKDEQQRGSRREEMLKLGNIEKMVQEVLNHVKNDNTHRIPNSRPPLDPSLYSKEKKLKDASNLLQVLEASSSFEIITDDENDLTSLVCSICFGFLNDPEQTELTLRKRNLWGKPIAYPVD